MSFDFASYLPSYNITWDSPSRDSMDSMPLSGRLGAGANAWVQDGSIWIYLGHSGAYDERGRLLKLGCVRITPAVDVFSGSSFRQELDLPSGRIEIRAGKPDAAGIEATLWFAEQTLVVEIASSSTLEIAYGSWRDQQRHELHLEVPVDVCDRTHDVGADDVVPEKTGCLFWHDNRKYASEAADDLEEQAWARAALHNPAKNLVFGGALASERPLDFLGSDDVEWQNWSGRAWRWRTREQGKHAFAVSLRAERDGKPKDWQREAEDLLDPARREKAAQEEQCRWDEFWDRSHIVINPELDARDPAWQAGRNYQLFRYMLACNRGGSLPLLFNGGIFTTDPMPGRITANNGEIPIEPAGPTTPDFRRWMFCGFMAQNQRWLGWPMIASGDIDLLEPSIAFYRDRSPTAADKARSWGAKGVAFAEPQKLWGLSWNARPDGKCRAEHLTENFNMGLEHAWMALCAHFVLGIDISRDLEWIIGTVLFYDSYYRAEAKRRGGQELSATGQLIIYPSTSVELIVGATNPIEVIAGLHRVTDGLLQLPRGDLSGETLDELRRIQKIIPDLPTGQLGGRTVLLPAEAGEKEFNLWEFPELYAAWPYRMAGVLKPETLKRARDTWELIPEHRAKLCKQDLSWMPVVVNTAALGLAEEAGHRLIAKLSDQRAQVRFPAFFGPGHDWVPDHNWGGSAMVGLQEMLLAADPYDSGSPLLLSAWPPEWEVAFKLHTKEKRIIDGHYREGRPVAK